MTADTHARNRVDLVPYIARWSAERTNTSPKVVVRPRGGGIAFMGEMTGDRDQRGVLWQREPLAQGRGRPEFTKMHGARQRRVMRKLLCQVCAGPADQDERGVLWLLPGHRDTWEGWPEQAAETTPPVCLPCAEASVRLCPRLRRDCAAVRVKNPRLCAVRGIVYSQLPGGPLPRQVGVDTVRFDDPRIRWTMAHHLVRWLHGCTVVDLDEELGTTGRNVR
jgi:hypothetical protein